MLQWTIMDRLRHIYNILTGSHASILPDNHLLVRDNRTNNTYHLPITPAGHSYSLPAQKLASITDTQGKSLKIYDPGYKYTLQAKTSICYVDGLRGQLQYRGYPIAQLANKSSFLETSFLLIFGELPSKEQLELFSKNVSEHTLIQRDLQKIMPLFRRNAVPIGVLVSSLFALSTVNPETNPALQGEFIFNNVKMRNKQIYKILGSLPTMVARIYRHQQGQDPVKPSPKLGYVQNFLYMLDSKLSGKPRLIKAVEQLWIVHAEEQSNSSTAMIRHVISSGTDLYTAIAAATGSLSGDKHGGASAAVIKMLEEIGSRQNIPVFLMEVRQKRRLLFGFGHRIYRDNDPRTTIIKQIVKEVFRVLGKRPLVRLAIQLQRIAQADHYFVTRRLNPNVDFYTALVYHSMGIPLQLFPLLYCIPRAAGWLAHWIECKSDPDALLARPSQYYVGYGRRQFLERSQREEEYVDSETIDSRWRVRRQASHHYKKFMS